MNILIIHPLVRVFTFIELFNLFILFILFLFIFIYFYFLFIFVYFCLLPYLYLKQQLMCCATIHLLS